MTKKVVRPILPVAPNQYDQVYINQLARALEFLIDEVRDAKINFQGIPGSGAANALERGDFFIADGGFIKVIVAEDFYSGSVQATGAVGTVTISVS
tara:strand:+ start:321 stop:608 length:288 start_codon:yes stop_codon:yes gene_type:complete